MDTQIRQLVDTSNPALTSPTKPLTPTGTAWCYVGMCNALDQQEQQQICALGRLGWTLVRIESATWIRRETISGFLKAAGIPGAGPRAAARQADGGADTRVDRRDGKTGNLTGGGVHRRGTCGCARRTLVLRQFHPEGFVNQCTVNSAESTPTKLVFDSERFENYDNAARARETYEVISADEFIETFELGEPGKPLQVYSRNHFKRIK